jgi:hypothetical protein
MTRSFGCPDGNRRPRAVRARPIRAERTAASAFDSLRCSSLRCAGTLARQVRDRPSAAWPSPLTQFMRPSKLRPQIKRNPAQSGTILNRLRERECKGGSGCRGFFETGGAVTGVYTVTSVLSLRAGWRPSPACALDPAARSAPAVRGSAGSRHVPWRDTRPTASRSGARRCARTRRRRCQRYRAGRAAHRRRRGA